MSKRDELLALAERAQKAGTTLSELAEIEAKKAGPRFYNWWKAARIFDNAPDLGSIGSYCGECGKRGTVNPDTENCAECDAAICRAAAETNHAG